MNFNFYRPYSSAIAERAVRLPPRARRLFLVAIDGVLLPATVWFSFWLRAPNPLSISHQSSFNWLLPLILFIGVPLYAFSGQYKGLTRYVGSIALYRLSCRNALLVLVLAGFGAIFRLSMPPRSSWILLWLLLTGFTGIVRFALRDLLLSLRSVSEKEMFRVAIYGAGEAGAQLAAYLRLAGNHQIVTFLDDDPVLWRRTINGIPIQPSSSLSKLDGVVDQVLLAIPSISRNARRRIVAQLQCQQVSVLQVPSVDDLTSGRARIDALRPLSIEDLLGRDPVPPVPELLGPGLRDSIVCVTGAAGSIGSELCRQIIQFSPKALILLEISEPSLYSLEQELRQVLPDSVALHPILGSAADPYLVQSLFSKYDVHIIFHAAAYKHVPLVESNPLAGIANNVGSTRTICQAAMAAGVSEVLLISTDKAVRPTNVMGASKRLAELVLQASALQSSSFNGRAGHPYTRFAMVRFGNVLGSSGSVVPLFRKQISEGGPITLTDPNIIRYFMTIPEAAQLVLQASTLSKGGDLFLLDMGEPVLIKELAEQMVRLSGLSVRSPQNPNGDIDIICTGLRPGEKLYEELLIDAESEPTAHPLIFRAQEGFLPPDVLWPRLDALDAAIKAQNLDVALSLLYELVPEWQRGDSV